jgi:hypothetical protein
MTAQQRTSVGLGEGVNKAGVGRGWWPNEVEGMNGGTVSQRREAVYSMAVEGDALWSLSGTQVGVLGTAHIGTNLTQLVVRTYQPLHLETLARTSRPYAQGSLECGVMYVPSPE